MRIPIDFHAREASENKGAAQARTSLEPLRVAIPATVPTQNACFRCMGLSTSGVDRQPYVLWPSEAIADHNFTSTRARCSAITLATRFSRESNNATNRKRLHGTGRQCRRHRQSRHNKNALPGFARVLRSGSNVETSLARRNMALEGAVLAAIREAPNRSACLNTPNSSAIISACSKWK